ncbi:hypothetical protein BBI01_17585 [Chryseobacterium artocarpi]|uniref:Uncharacterized protein n=1 Tax=Chryseobacterium artocarpi TaxID=1414727 RepID=A0A1B8ZBL8_9FLAO|nr:hypothetical protein BBI01_17585 [Chryseobacterium artocarpi]
MVIALLLLDLTIAAVILAIDQLVVVVTLAVEVPEAEVLLAMSQYASARKEKQDADVLIKVRLLDNVRSGFYRSFVFYIFIM